jgi:hypothetical protein
LPSRVFAIKQAWPQPALTGIDLLAWTRRASIERPDHGRAGPSDRVRTALTRVEA